jgi:hypothetical protein
MTEIPGPSAKARPHLSAALVLVAAALALLAAELPLVVAAILLGSVVIHRPLLARVVGRPDGSTSLPVDGVPSDRNRTLGRATLATGGTLLFIGAAQALGAARFGLSVTTASGILARTTLALVAEAVLALALVHYLKRRLR